MTTTITINANNLSQEFCFPAKSEAVYQESISSPHSTEYSDNAEHEYSELTQEISTPELKDWSEKKDKVLKNLAAKCKYDWKKIAKKFNTNEKTEFTPLELKQKYKDLTKVAIPLRVKFTHQEDLQIAKYFEIYGCDWAQISTFFTDRTPMMLKNRYYSHIRKRNLLSSMLDELKDDTESLSTQEEQEEVTAPVTLQAQPEITKNEDEDDDSFKFFFERSDGIFFRKFSANNFFDLENAIPNELFDKIAF